MPPFRNHPRVQSVQNLSMTLFVSLADPISTFEYHLALVERQRRRRRVGLYGQTLPHAGTPRWGRVGLERSKWTGSHQYDQRRSRDRSCDASEG